jgi:hypothetical protein
MSLKQLGVFLDGTTGLGILLLLLSAAAASVYFSLRRSSLSLYKGKITVLAGILITAGIFFGFTFTFPIRGEVSAAVVPRLWVSGILVCCLYLLFTTIGGKETPDVDSKNLPLVFSMMGLSIAFLAMINFLGFFPSSFLFLVAGMIRLSYRKKVVIFTVATGWVVMSYFVFYKLLFVPLPEGFVVRLITG